MFTSQSNVYIHARMLNYFIQCSFFSLLLNLCRPKKTEKRKKCIVKLIVVSLIMLQMNVHDNYRKIDFFLLNNFLKFL